MMTPVQIAEIAGYFSNPMRDTHLEIEIPEASIPNYQNKYLVDSGLAFPHLPNDAVYVIPRGGDKWGREMRIYFNCTANASLPASLIPIVTVGGRPGYNQDSRVNDNALIDKLIEYGFVMGSMQSPARIRGRIPTALRAFFDNGFNLP